MEETGTAVNSVAIPRFALVYGTEFNEKFIKENSVTLSISFNGKTRFTMSFPVEATKEEIEKEVLAGEQAKKYIDGKQIVKVIVVPGRIVNIVVR
jgi:leucyl-tRNA synthetase